MHTFGSLQGLGAQDKQTFHVGEAPNANSDSILTEKIDNPALGNFAANSSLTSVTSDVALLMLKIFCLGQQYDALLDSGSSHNFISQQVFEQLKKLQKAYHQVGIKQASRYQLQVVLADGTTINSKLKTCIKVKLANGLCMHVEYNVVTTLAQQVVLGMLFLRATNPAVDWKDFVVKFRGGNDIQAVPVAPGGIRPSLQEVSAKTAVRLARQQGSAAWFALIKSPEKVQTGLLASADGCSEPFVAALPQFQLLVTEYRDVFEAPGAPAPGQVTHRIDLLDKLLTLPRQRAQRMSPAELAESRRQIDDMLAKGWIRPSASPYGAPLLFVRKKTGELCMCIDYRMLNRQTRLDRFPIPRINDLLDKLATVTVFSKIDRSNAYHQVSIEEGYYFKMAFQTSFGLYEWLVLPLGLCNAPATFQCLMHDVFPTGQHDFVIVYLDDILTFLHDKSHHFEHIKYVLEQLRKYGLKAKAKKTALCLDQVEYLGHIIQNGTIHEDPGKVAAVAEQPVPSDIKQL